MSRRRKKNSTAARRAERTRRGKLLPSVRFAHWCAAAFMVLAGFVFYAWVQLSLVSTGYELSRYMHLERKLSRQCAKLGLEVATFKNPVHLAAIGSSRLGLKTPGEKEVRYVDPQRRRAAQLAAVP